MELWIARNNEGDLILCDYHISKIGNRLDILPWAKTIEINKKLFPEVTFENSPQKVELKLVEK